MVLFRCGTGIKRVLNYVLEPEQEILHKTKEPPRGGPINSAVGTIQQPPALFLGTAPWRTALFPYTNGPLRGPYLRRTSTLGLGAHVFLCFQSPESRLFCNGIFFCFFAGLVREIDQGGGVVDEDLAKTSELLAVKPTQLKNLK